MGRAGYLVSLSLKHPGRTIPRMQRPATPLLPVSNGRRALSFRLHHYG